jgi:diguanylate cyclase (GGDEF)-like protein/PAS domain S-box-containing protein
MPNSALNKKSQENRRGVIHKKVKCWEVFSCREKDCPAYEIKNLMCWLISGTRCRNEIQGKFIEKMEMCLDCEIFSLNMDVSAMRDTIKAASKQFKRFRKHVDEKDSEMEDANMELAIGLSETFEALKKIATGDPTVRTQETSKIELINKLKQIVNLTAENIGEIVNQSHEFAICLAEHFDVLNKVSKGDLSARVSGDSNEELLESLKKVTNHMVDNISKEITDRKQAEIALKESKQKLKNIIEHSNEIFYIHDMKHRLIFISPQCLQILGYSPVEMMTEWTNLVTEDPINTIGIELTERALKTGKRQKPYLLELYRKDLRRVWLEIDESPLKNNKGKVIGMVGAARDVTERKQAEEEVRESEARFKDISYSMADWIWEVDEKGAYTYCSEKVFDLLGYLPEEIIGKTPFDFMPPKEAEMIKPLFQKIVENKEPIKDLENWNIRKDGKRILVRTNGMPILDEKRNLKGYRGVDKDITERRKSQEALKESEARFRAISNTAADAILLMDSEGKISYWNPAAEKIFGYSSDETLGKDLHSFLSPKRYHEDASKGFEKFKKTGQGPAIGNTLEFSAIKKDGTEFPIEVSTSAIQINGKWCSVGIVRDISDRKRSEEQITYIAYHDTITDLPNRHFLKDRLQQALASAKQHKRVVAVLFLDLDNFKRINDTFGHDVGDNLLKSVADRLAKYVRKSDTIARIDTEESHTTVARLGGDEFTLLLTEISNIQSASKVAQRILDLFRHPFIVGNNEMFITTSIGISLYPDDGEDVDTLLKNADRAMYYAKDQGRNNFQFYTESMNIVTIERIAMENSLRKALDRKELQVYYQPQLDISSGKIIGAEALLRWLHEEKGLLPPSTFIPMAEETGLIVPIGEWVLRTACAQNKAWQDAGFAPIYVTVNISSAQFKQKTFLETVARLLNDTGLEPKYLELELTESILIESTEMAIITLNELKNMGIRLSIDDFGTGYSSLSYLKKFPIDILKIDRSFVRNLSTDPDDRAIINAIIAMAHTLNLKVIAEGVENEQQLAFLHEQGSDGIQGYIFSPPVPTDLLTQYMKEGKSLNTIVNLSGCTSQICPST